MNNEKVRMAIEESFRKRVKKDSKVKNGYLLVHSEKAGIDLNIAEGTTGEYVAHPDQPNYMASVGKLFTSALISILFEKGKLSFQDKISQYVDQEIMEQLHVYKGIDYSNDITIEHLLKQTSGLADNFEPLLEKLIEDPQCKLTPREAVIWGKNNLQPHFPPGEKLKYTDTNYHLLGLIIENITGISFADALKEYIFMPLDMRHSFVLHASSPMEPTNYPIADFYINGERLNEMQGYYGLDYAGGGVVAPMADLLKFMKALVHHQLIYKDTLDIMKNEPVKFDLGIGYGHGIWMIRTVPIIMPKHFNSWGCAGVTGAFMFYHPELETYMIGNFNHDSYKSKAIRFMLLEVISKLYKAMK